MMMRADDTIAAIATPAGKGGIGVIRLSGPKAKVIAEVISQKTLIPRLATYTKFYSENKNILDQGILLFFPTPHSFTGEDVVEFQAHGGPVVLDSLLSEIIKKGARRATPGEFSQRAFLNDKMDLSQAEAVADLIEAGSQQAASAA